MNRTVSSSEKEPFVENQKGWEEVKGIDEDEVAVEISIEGHWTEEEKHIFSDIGEIMSSNVKNETKVLEENVDWREIEVGTVRWIDFKGHSKRERNWYR